MGNPATQVMAVCDPFESKRMAAKQRAEDRYAEEIGRGSYKGCDAYADFRELVTRDDIDAVVIASPEPLVLSTLAVEDPLLRATAMQLATRLPGNATTAALVERLVRWSMDLKRNFCAVLIVAGTAGLGITWWLMPSPSEPASSSTTPPPATAAVAPSAALPAPTQLPALAPVHRRADKKDRLP